MSDFDQYQSMRPGCQRQTSKLRHAPKCTRSLAGSRGNHLGWWVTMPVPEPNVAVPSRRNRGYNWGQTWGCPGDKTAGDGLPGPLKALCKVMAGPPWLVVGPHLLVGRPLVQLLPPSGRANSGSIRPGLTLRARCRSRQRPRTRQAWPALRHAALGRPLSVPSPFPSRSWWQLVVSPALATGSPASGSAVQSLVVKTVVLGQLSPDFEALLARRRALGQDLFDEIWAGEYHVAPAPHPWHGYLEMTLGELLGPLARAVGLVGTGPFNLGDKDDYRVPDLGYHRGLPANVWVPTAAIVVEVVSPDDETWEKFDFYASHDVDEICVADPVEAQLTWFIRDSMEYRRTASSELLGITLAQLRSQIDWPH
jgi:Uma2 family endonuclease